MSKTRQSYPGVGVFLKKHAAYSGTDATVEVDMEGLKKVFVVGIVPVGSAHALEDMSHVDETKDSDGLVQVPSTGTITIRRKTSGTSGKKINLLVIGY